MGFFSKLFGEKKLKTDDSSTSPELRLEYNVMKNISLDSNSKYENTELYEFVENGIYKDLNDDDDAKYRITISYELTSNETNNQYPLEDVLDKYYLHVSDFLEKENDSNSNKFKRELGGTLDDVIKAKEIIGKKIFNCDYLDEGQVRVKLVIE